VKTVIIIPARYGSSRLRGKPLYKILGREMVLRVADICSKVVGIKNLYIATDSKKISKVALTAGYKVVMTSSKCLTGTDRVAEAAMKIKSDIYINVQGDEPTINPIDIKNVIKAKVKNSKYVVCGYDKVHKFEDASSINLPKVVVNHKQELIYISRALVPSKKKGDLKVDYLKQVCIYAFNRDQLKKFNSRKKKSETEKIEDIEILRFFDLDIKIKMTRLHSNSVAVDVIEDVKKVEKLLKNEKKIY